MPTELHLALQRYYAGKRGKVEAWVGGYRVDVLRRGVAYEIQTASFAALRDKLRALAEIVPVVLVHPIAQTKLLVRVDPESGEAVGQRRSPKRGKLLDVGWELLYLAEALQHENLALEVALIVEREKRVAAGQRRWGKDSTVGRELVEVVETKRFRKPQDFARLLPKGLKREFTVKELAEAGGISSRLAGRLAYGLRRIGAVELVGKRGRAYVYRRGKTRVASRE